MNAQEREAVATICLLAAFADGHKDDAERQQIKAVVDSLEGVSSPALYQKVLLKQVTLEEAAQALESPETRTLAFEMAAGVVDADGVMNDAERDFLQHLGRALDLPQQTAQGVLQSAEAIASSDVSTPVLPDETPPQGAEPADSTTGTDSMILRYAVLAGSLELLPQSLATMAILPLQMKLVYRVGQEHGYTLDSGHVREFLAVAGVGMTSQVFEGYARKLFGSAAKKAFGKKGKKVAKGATGPLMSFATTYGLGQVAQLYYSSGRTLTQQQVRDAFDKQLEQGKTLFDQYQGEVQARSQTLDVRELMGTLGR